VHFESRFSLRRSVFLLLSLACDGVGGSSQDDTVVDETADNDPTEGEDTPVDGITATPVSGFAIEGGIPNAVYDPGHGKIHLIIHSLPSRALRNR
jgi:hypothetical protein